MPVITGGKIIEGSRPAWRNNATVGQGWFSSPGVPAGGFLNAVAQPGALCVDLVAGNLYENTGTLAATIWTLRGSVI